MIKFETSGLEAVAYIVLGFVAFWFLAGAGLKLGWYLTGKLMGLI